MSDIRLICFYLPQFHPIPENDEWWEAGFTEWHNVTRARPLFNGHYQPHLPGELGFYDLRVPEVRDQQAALAQEYGIHAFCYYHYWFGEKRLLERPFTEVLHSGRPQLPFCLCWANENWTRRWDGADNQILVEQTYCDDQAEDFISSLLPAFKDSRYIRVHDRPVLVVYDSSMLSDPQRSTTLWRKLVRAAGFDGLYLVRVERWNKYGKYDDPTGDGFDAALEFPPHGIRAAKLAHLVLDGGATSWSAHDYEDLAFHSIHRTNPPFTLLRGIVPGWDNTPRRPSSPSLFHGSSPSAYGQWLSELVRWTRQYRDPEERIVFVNAWNEWAEGAHLEPDQRWGRAYLQATAQALRSPGQSVSAATTAGDELMKYAHYTLGNGDSLLRDGKPLMQADSITGSLDNMELSGKTTSIYGSAVDANSPYKPLQILVFYKRTYVATGRTLHYRANLAGEKGIQYLKSGYEIELPLLKSSTYTPEGLAMYALSTSSEYKRIFSGDNPLAQPIKCHAEQGGS